tara:strand:+ start:244 stop:1530 length:1287 start_codon:yes stop_codon:yes gene_type:complete
MDDIDINYFDKDIFQKYYEEIDIQQLEDPVIEEKRDDTSIAQPEINETLPLKIEPEDKEIVEIEEYIYNKIKVVKGDNFAKILKKGGLRGRDIDLLIINGSDIYDFSKIYLGDIINIYSQYNNELLNKFELIYRFSKTQELIVSYQENEFIYEVKSIPTIEEEIFVSGIIKTSLYQSMKAQGLSELIINEVIRIYSFDVDFQRDIYEGDSFEILFTRKKNEQGEVIQINDPKYLMLSSRGTQLTYYLFSNNEFSEYFDENGKGMTKSLMKTPINGARLSSSYGMRKHPISGFNKMHKGVDFAAPTGTPIFAAGNGVVEFAGRNGGYGKYIRIRHDSTYKTAYAHLSAYKKGIYGGVRVKQGDIIGYVGSTGKSTGPHLHYEIIVNGKQINPATLKLPSGRKLNEKQLKELNILIKKINLELNDYKKLS